MFNSLWRMIHHVSQTIPFILENRRWPSTHVRWVPFQLLYKYFLCLMVNTWSWSVFTSWWQPDVKKPFLALWASFMKESLIHPREWRGRAVYGGGDGWTHKRGSALSCSVRPRGLAGGTLTAGVLLAGRSGCLNDRTTDTQGEVVWCTVWSYRLKKEEKTLPRRWWCSALLKQWVITACRLVSDVSFSLGRAMQSLPHLCRCKKLWG